MVNTSFTIQKQVPVISNSDLVPLRKIATLEHVYPTIRKLFTKSIPNVPLLANFITVWGKITLDQENLSIVKRHEIKFASLQFKEKTLMLTKMSKNIFITGTERFGNLGERYYTESSTYTRAISKQPLPCRKKGWSESPSDKFKKSQQIYSLRAFQNGVPALSFYNRTTCYARWISRCEISISRCEISMVRPPKPFFCLCFGLEPALRTITKLLSHRTALLRRFMVKLQTSHIRMTYEWHADDIRVKYEWHMSDILATCKYIHKTTYEWHMDDILVYTNDIQMAYEYLRVTCTKDIGLHTIHI